ncbi:MAG: hypothetical protein J7J07_02215 [Syntrophobacterales bacterium]|nr:hypothetical protein [Syntrophobacterales bacterium]
MKSVIFFNSINISAPGREIFRRLGYRKGITRIGEDQKEIIEDYIEYALSLIHLRGAGRRISIKEKSFSNIVLSNGITFKSKGLSKMIGDCKEIILMGATAGDDVIESIRGDTEANQLTRGVVLDAVASEMVDASLDWIVDYFNRDLRRENKRLTKSRFSAGYGDFILENQKVIYDTLQLERIGVQINENYILTPEKSVTAVAGIQSRFSDTGRELESG